MQKITIAVIVLIVVAVATYYLVFQKPIPEMPMNNTYATSTEQTQTEAQTPVSSAVTITIKDFAFSPSMITVKPGTKITWINNDSVSHTVTSDTGGMLNSGILASGQSYTVTAPASGSISYHCTIHPMMKGTILIQG